MISNNLNPDGSIMQTLSFAPLVIALMLCGVSGAVFAQEKDRAQTSGKVEVSGEGEWDPVEEFQNPEYTFEKNPWTATAKALSKKRQSNIDVNAVTPFIGFEGCCLSVLKALGIRATIQGEAEGYVAATKEVNDIDVVSYKYQGVTPFELRHTPYVWCLVLKTSAEISEQNLVTLLGINLGKYDAKLEPMDDPEKVGYDFQLRGSKLPPSVADAIIFRTEEEIVISGSSISGPISIPASHQLGSNRKWLLRYLPK